MKSMKARRFQCYLVHVKRTVANPSQMTSLFGSTLAPRLWHVQKTIAHFIVLLLFDSFILTAKNAAKFNNERKIEGNCEKGQTAARNVYVCVNKMDTNLSSVNLYEFIAFCNFQKREKNESFFAA